MKVFGKYFAHRAKGTLPRFFIIATLILIYLVPQLLNMPAFFGTDSWYVYKNLGRDMADRFNSITAVNCILCTVIPILEFSGFHNRKNADTMLSMPISRPKLALVHYLNGAWQLVAIWSACIFTYAAVVYQHGEKCYEVTGYFLYGDMKMFIPYYFTAVLCALLVYSFFVLVFNFANNVADGVVFVLAYILAVWVLAVGFGDLFHVDIPFLSDLIPYSLILNVDDWFFAGLMNDNFMLKTVFKNGWMLERMIIPAVIALVGILVFLGCFILLFTYKKAEKLEGISSFALGYASLIPVYGMSISAICFVNGADVQNIAFVVIPMVVAYMIYRRSFKLKVSDVVMIVLTIALMFAADAISTFFGTVKIC